MLKFSHSLLSLCFFSIISFYCVAEVLPKDTVKPTIKILAIDGGGIRGIIPIKILSYLESQLGPYGITQKFDVMSGTSSGGIIVLLLNVPKQDKSPKYNMQDIQRLFKEFGGKVFDRSLFQKVVTINGWVGPKYNDKNLKAILSRFMEDYTILDTLKDVIISAYDLVDEKNYFFRKTKALESRDRVFYLKDIARSTTAAPTYFNPAIIKDVDKLKKHIMVDGGVSVNNPALSALVYAYSQYKHNSNYFVLSIGTGSTLKASKSKLDYYKMDVENAGKLKWASNIIPLLMDSVNDVTDYQLQELLSINNYYRLQVTIDPEYSDLDNIDPDNIAALEKYAEDYIQNNKEALNQIVEHLKRI